MKIARILPFCFLTLTSSTFAQVSVRNHPVDTKPSREGVRHVISVPNASGPPETLPPASEPSEEAQNVLAKIRARVASMRDEHGQIPPNARYEANVWRRSNLKAASGSGTPYPSSILTSNPLTTWVSRGPTNVGGRTRSIVVDTSTTPETLYAASVSGGIWKSTDAGSTWTAEDDMISNLNVQSLVMDPNNHNVLYASTGESFSYNDGPPGSGIFKTSDAGAHWTQLPTTVPTQTADWTRVFTLTMQASNSSVLLCAKSDGIWRTTDAGQSQPWQHVYTPPFGYTEFVAFNPNAGQTQHVIAVGTSGTSFANVYLQLLYSDDGGITWLPAAMPANLHSWSDAYGAWTSASGVFFVIGTPSGFEIWKSSDGDNGHSYTRVSQQTLGGGCNEGRCAMWLSPVTSGLMVVAGIHAFRSTDGGVTFPPDQLASWWFGSSDAHDDIHCLVAKGVSNTVYAGTDGGVYRAKDMFTVKQETNSWDDLNAGYQTSQYYGAAGLAFGSWPLVGGTQDNGTLRVFYSDDPMQSAGVANQISLAGDGGPAAIDPIDPNYVYGEYSTYTPFRSTNGGGPFSAVIFYNGLPGGGVISGGNYSALIMDPNDRNTLLLGAGSALWRTTSASLDSPSWQQYSNYVAYSGVAGVAIAPSDSNTVWVGEASGQIQKTTNALSISAGWSDVENNTTINRLPDRAVLCISIDHEDVNTVYVGLGGYSANSTQPSNVWRTTNGGTSWAPLPVGGSTGLPMVPIRSIARHPRNKNYLWAATDIGIYESQDYGATWATSALGPGDVSVDELAFIKGSEVLLAATHGRGLWSADTSGVPTFAPTGVRADATVGQTNSIAVHWNALNASVTSYQVMRSSDAAQYANAPNGLVSGTSTAYSDSSVVSGKTYLYKVKALVSGVWTDLSLPDLATVIQFTNDLALSTPVRALDLNEARAAVSDVMSAAGLTSSFGTAVVGSPIRATDIADLRQALISAYAAIGMPGPPTFSETIQAMVTSVKGAHLQEIRNAVK